MTPTHSDPSYHKLTLACFLSASLEVHLPTVACRDLWGSYDFYNDKIVLKEFESHFPGRNQLWKYPFDVGFSYEKSKNLGKGRREGPEGLPSR